MWIHLCFYVCNSCIYNTSQKFPIVFHWLVYINLMTLRVVIRWHLTGLQLLANSWQTGFAWMSPKCLKTLAGCHFPCKSRWGLQSCWVSNNQKLQQISFLFFFFTQRYCGHQDPITVVAKPSLEHWSLILIPDSDLCFNRRHPWLMSRSKIHAEDKW